MDSLSGLRDLIWYPYALTTRPDILQKKQKKHNTKKNHHSSSCHERNKENKGSRHSYPQKAGGFAKRKNRSGQSKKNFFLMTRMECSQEFFYCLSIKGDDGQGCPLFYARIAQVNLRNRLAGNYDQIH